MIETTKAQGSFMKEEYKESGLYHHNSKKEMKTSVLDVYDAFIHIVLHFVTVTKLANHLLSIRDEKLLV